MINLLPPEEKNNLQREEKYRLVLIFGALALFFLVSLSLILFSIKIYISGKAEAQKILFELEEKSFQASEIKKVETEINLINQNLTQLDSFYKSQINLSELLEKISQALPVQTYLDTLSLDSVAKKENKFQVSLQGHCATRELLFEFKQKLESEPSFQEVYFPPQNWTKPKDIDFSVTFGINL